MKKFIITHRKKRKYIKKTSYDSLSALLPLLTGFLPICIIVASLIIVPLITRKPVIVSLPKLSLPPLILKMTNDFLYAVRSLPHSHYLIIFFKMITVRSLSLKFPVITIDLSLLAAYYTDIIAVFVSSSIKALQIFYTSFVIFFLTLNPLPLLQVAMSIILKGTISLTSEIFTGFMSFLFFLGKTIFQLCAQTGEIFTLFTYDVARAFLTTVKFIDQMCIQCIYGIHSIVVAVIDSITHGFVSLFGFLFHILLQATDIFLSFSRTVVFIIMTLGETIYFSFLAIITKIIHLIELPFILLGNYLEQLRPTLSSLNKVFTTAQNAMIRDFIRTFSLTAELIHYATRK